MEIKTKFDIGDQVIVPMQINHTGRVFVLKIEKIVIEDLPPKQEPEILYRTSDGLYQEHALMEKPSWLNLDPQEDE